MQWLNFINYIVWYIFVFLAVVWLLTLFRNRENLGKGPKAGRLPSVSVLIPAYNEERNISRAIKSVLNLEYPKKLLEVIVINDGSKDRTLEKIRKFGKKVKIINNPKNRGKAYCLNQGLKHARGELVACLDADSVVSPKALKKMVGYFEDPQIAAVTPALKVLKKENFWEKIQHAEYLLNIFLRKILAFLDAVHVTPGVFTLYRKSVLLELGGFDEKNLAEDMEIALRIHEAGYKIENELKAISYTLCPARFKELLKQRIRWYRGGIRNSLKYRHMFFRSKYGNLGLFFLPANFIATFAVILIFFMMLNYGLVVFTDIVRKAGLVGWDLSVFLSGFDLFGYLFKLSTPFFLTVISLFIASWILLKSFRISRMPFKKNKPGYFLYLLVFPFILTVFWTLALLNEVFRVKAKW
ncbi:MAG: hypothetical protein DRP12_01440 [Candidatus Aenigmatarchaeota archaeon]|nr:MAG: hypothetical protein DRP12_01440 [Candidatus Aenigmarchaeota archaeon]